ncbi:TPA: carnitine metabolism transcriptional regulator CaiF [Proteus mirabilis]|uniref:Transcriptional activator for carnitine metabolism n=1 Tax=Proteus mirabilis (strain HI4320) TaxID=529507 RepID=B4EY28_PROMH|nr:carnitine metabolism transcriptional regulator CaiF [Proteus mirabilis]EKT8674547.1 carnitine metabolism transcriptional regulator CaiF [Proteus mirabilis]MBG3077231.1 carnitine metabolism transcriptional regulator CaiF [Proteus mirabilis]MBG3125152.1 carnitine metabolism transcriptional regulator CaiF [Proteus mirabilis]MBI6384227.1 carnitine metabolism transcriptional regulator CaiF [Proteus mirabilis]UZK72323.1 carnitine metabolism transcriptional regulator CaiF [Proteus mirabilis]
MCEEDINKPLYLLIADWVQEQQRWVSAKEIAKNFDIPQCNAINIVSYILSDVKEIECDTKSVPNQLEGRGCQCQRMIKVSHIDPALYARLKGHTQSKSRLSAPEKLAAMIPHGLDHQQKWQWMLSKSQRR